MVELGVIGAIIRNPHLNFFFFFFFLGSLNCMVLLVIVIVFIWVSYVNGIADDV